MNASWPWILWRLAFRFGYLSAITHTHAHTHNYDLFAILSFFARFSLHEVKKIHAVKKWQLWRSTCDKWAMSLSMHFIQPLKKLSSGFCWLWLDFMCMCLRCSSITSFESHLNVFIHQNALHAHRATTLDCYYVQIKMTKLFAQKYIYKNVLSHDHTERNSTCECECVDNNEYMRTIFSFHSSSSSSLHSILRCHSRVHSVARTQTHTKFSTRPNLAICLCIYFVLFSFHQPF